MAIEIACYISARVVETIEEEIKLYWHIVFSLQLSTGGGIKIAINGLFRCSLFSSTGSSHSFLQSHSPVVPIVMTE